jgi:hypothetical protein
MTGAAHTHHGPVTSWSACPSYSRYIGSRLARRSNRVATVLSRRVGLSGHVAHRAKPEAVDLATNFEPEATAEGEPRGLRPNLLGWDGKAAAARRVGLEPDAPALVKERVAIRCAAPAGPARRGRRTRAAPGWPGCPGQSWSLPRSVPDNHQARRQVADRSARLRTLHPGPLWRRRSARACPSSAGRL